MAKADQNRRPSRSAGDLEVQRAVVRSLLDDIATETGNALRNERLDFPVYLTIPNSGHALATVVSPLDPPDGEWSQAIVIVQRIIGNRLGGIGLRSRELVCAVANGV